MGSRSRAQRILSDKTFRIFERKGLLLLFECRQTITPASHHDEEAGEWVITNKDPIVIAISREEIIDELLDMLAATTKEIISVRDITPPSTEGPSLDSL